MNAHSTRTATAMGIVLLLLTMAVSAAGCGGSSASSGAQPSSSSPTSATPSPLASATGTADEAAQATAVMEGIHSIQVGVMAWQVDHYKTRDVFPKASQVRRQPGFAKYILTGPTNPYTGRPMAPGTGPGDYTYTVSNDRQTFTLTGYGSDGKVIVTVP